MFQVIPSLDILDGKVIRLIRGDFATRTIYGEPEEVLEQLRLPRGTCVHVVDLAGSRDGNPVALDVVRRLARHDLRVQVGGGVRNTDSVRAWIDAGAERVVVGTVAAENPDLLAAIVARFGAERIVPAIDVESGRVRVSGWQRESSTSLAEVLRIVARVGIHEVLATDIARDGLLSGPSFDLYREFGRLSKLRVIASGGVTTLADVVSLARLPNVIGCVIGKAMLENRVSFGDASARVDSGDTMPARIIPCLDVRDCRVVKGVNFTDIRDAGDPVECARRYEAEGADELVILDISATDTSRDTAIETVRQVAESIFIPLTVGGGVRTVDDFRAMLRAGADRVAINTAALRNPQLIADCASEFGVQAVVLSCDAKRVGDGWLATARSGKEATEVDAIEWCRRAESLGAGEILLTSVDRDGTNAGFDLDLLRAATAEMKIGVIASGGAGCPEHFLDAIERGGARAALAASLFHDRVLTIGEVKGFLAGEGIPVR